MAYLPGMSKKGFTVRCTSCTGSFKLTKSNLQTHRATEQELIDNKVNTTPGIKYYKTHYYCKHCKKEYIVCFINQFLKSDLGPRIKEARAKGEKAKADFFAKLYKKEMDHINNR